MKNILVPTDFSACAGNAVDFAVQSSKYLPLKVILLHSFEMEENIYSDYVGLDKEYKRSLLTDINNKLADIRKEIHDRDGVEVETCVSTKPLFNALEDVTRERDISLVIMGTLGATGFQGKLFGSNTAAWVEKSKVPVMVVPNEYKWKQPLKMLLATNRFEEENKMLDELFFDAARLFNASIEVVVFTEEDDAKTADFINNERKAFEYEARLRKAFMDTKLKVSSLRGSDFEDTLQTYIKDNDIDILAMITYQKEKVFGNVYSAQALPNE